MNRSTRKLFSRLNGDVEAGFTLIVMLILTNLAVVEPTLTGTSVTVPTHTATAFKITVSATGGNTFSIESNASTLSYPCTVASSNRGGCLGAGLVAGVWG